MFHLYIIINCAWRYQNLFIGISKKQFVTIYVQVYSAKYNCIMQRVICIISKNANTLTWQIHIKLHTKFLKVTAILKHCHGDPYHVHDYNTLNKQVSF